MAERKTEKTKDDDLLTTGGIGVIIFGCLLVLAKYSPPLIFGAVFGWFLYGSKYGPTVHARIRAYLMSLSFFASLCFLLVGFPGANIEKDYIGLMPYVPGFWGWCKSVAHFWNQNAPGLSFLKGLKVMSLSYADVVWYFWISVPSSIVFSGVYYGFNIFKTKKKAARLKSISSIKKADPDLFKTASLPGRLMRHFLYIFTLGWMRFGASAGAKLRGQGILSNLTLTIVFLSGIFVSQYFSKYLVEISVLSLKWVVTFLVFAPSVCINIGFILSKILPDSALQFLDFESGESQNPKHTNKAEFELGKDNHGRPFRLTEQNLAYHIEMVAPTGSGKTNTLKNLIAHRISQNHGVIFLDYKAEFDVVAWMYRAACTYGRENEFRFISLSNRELSVPYNPIRFGVASEIHSQIMNSMTWSEEFYRKISSVALLTLLRGLTEYRDKTGEAFHIRHIYELLEVKGLLREFALRLSELKCPSAQDLALLAEKLDRPSEREKLMGLIANLHIIVHSSAGELIGNDVTSGAYDFREAIDQSRITYVLMNSLKLKESASVFGKMILQDLMTFVGDRYSSLQAGIKQRPVTLIIDEFASFAIPEFIEFMDRARGAGIGIVLAHQARADLRKISPEFQERIEANANTTLVSGLKSSQDAEYYAGMLGTRTTEKETRQVEDGFFGSSNTGMKSIRNVEEYIVHPNQLKDLEQGQLFAISRTVDPRWGIVQVGRAPEFKNIDLSEENLITALTKIRTSYLKNGERYLDLNNKPSGLKTQILEQIETEKPKADLWS